MPTPAFVLASASPARRRLLVGAGIDPIVCPSQFDEDSIQIDDPAELVKALAFHKADQVTQRLLAAPSDLGLDTSQALVLGCDSLLWVNGHIYGKPDSPAEAIARWRVMAGQTGELYTGHALIDPMQRQGIVRERMTRVTFAAIGDRQIEAYVSTGEPLQCAGCFALEGRGGQFIEEISGCHSNVIGLSLPLLRHMMNDLGYDITDFWQS